MIINKQLGLKLLRARENKGWTQEILAEKVGFSTKQLQKYEHGFFPQYKKETIKKLDGYLGTNIHEEISEQNVPRETEDKLTVAQEEQGLYVSHKKTQVIDKDQIIADLAHTNRSLHEELNEIKIRLKKLEDKQFIESGDLEKLLGDSPTIDEILEGIGAVGEGKRWHSGKEGKASLQIKIHERLKNLKKVKV